MGELFDSLKPVQQQAIELLVIGDPDNPGKRLKYGDIAERCGVAEFTLRRWRQDPRFNAARKEFRDETFKPDIVEESLRALMYKMRNDHSVSAAEVALKWSGEMVERRVTEGTMNVNQQIDVRNSDQAQIMDRLKQLQQELDLPEGALYIGQGDVIDADIVEDEDDSRDKDDDRNE